MRKFYKRNIFYFAGVAMIAIIFQVKYLNNILGLICRICPHSDIGGIMLTVLYFLILFAQVVPIIQGLFWLYWG